MIWFYVGVLADGDLFPCECEVWKNILHFHMFSDMPQNFQLDWVCHKAPIPEFIALL